MTDQVEKFLASVPLFRNLKDRQIKRIASRMRERSYKAGEVIVEQGKMGIGLFIIVTGEADVIHVHPDGSTHKLNTMVEKDFFGELSLLDEAPRTASVIANGDVQCLALTKLDFLDVLGEEPEMAVEMLKTMAQRFRRSMDHI